MRAHCKCGNLVEKSHIRVNGEVIYKDMCRTCRGRYRYGILKGSKCEDCGLIPQVSAQLEVDHVDGNNKNNDPINLRTLCCNCHALKSYNRGDIRFLGKDNPMFGKKHTETALEKIRKRSNSRKGNKHDLRKI